MVGVKCEEVAVQNSAKYGQSVGAKSEELVAGWLAKNGYEVLERNYRSKFGEIDVIVRKDEKVFFVEVRARSGVSGLDSAVESVDRRKLMKIKATIRCFLASGAHGCYDNADLGILVIAVNWYNSRRARIKVVEVE